MLRSVGLAFSPQHFSDPQLEQQFQKHYAWSRLQFDAAAVVVCSAAVLAKPIWNSACCFLAKWYSTGICQCSAGPALQLSAIPNFRSALSLLPFLASLLFFGTRYMIITRAAATVVTRTLFVLTMIPSSRLRNQAVWHHRVLFIHFGMAAVKAPQQLYWLGGITSWLAALVMDTAVLPSTCGQSVTCVFRTLQITAASWVTDAVNDPTRQSFNLITVLCSRSSLMHLGGLVAPWLLMLYMEHRARQAWFANQQQSAAAIHVGASDPAHQQHQQCELPEQAALSATPGKGSSSSSTCDARPATLPAEAAAQSTAVDNCMTASRDPEQPGESRLQSAQGQVTAVPPDRASALQYVSPLHRQVVSYKFSHPPDAKPDDYTLLRQKLITALQQHLTSTATASPCATGTAPNSPQADAAPAKAVVTGCISFRGCWQVILDTVTSRAAAAATDSSPPSSREQQQLNVVSQAIHTDFPDWNFTAWQHVEECNAASSAAAAEGGLAASCSRLLYVDPAAVAITSGAAAAATTSSSLVSNLTTIVELVLPGVLVQQLVSAGHETLRVIVAHQPEDNVLLDQTYPLSDTTDALHRASCNPASEDATAAAAAPNALKIQLPLAAGSAAAAGAEAAGFEDCHVLSVVVLLTDTVLAADAGSAQLLQRKDTVLSKIPLLLLPPTAQQEVQDLVTAAAASTGCSHAEAYQAVLPLLRDWSMLLLPPPRHVAADRALEAHHQQLKAEARSALLEFLDKADKLHCYKLVSRQQQQHHAGDKQQQRQVHAAAVCSQATNQAAASTAAATAGDHTDCEPKAFCSNSSSSHSATLRPAAVRLPVVTWKTVVFGFSDSDVRRAYDTYKAIALMRHARLFAFLNILAMLGTCFKAVAMFRSVDGDVATAIEAATAEVASSGTGDPFDDAVDSPAAEALSFIARTFLVTCWLFPQLLLLLAAGCASAQCQPGGLLRNYVVSLVHRRDAVFVAMLAIYISSLHAMLQFDWTLRAVVSVAVQAVYVSAIPLIIHNTVLQPVMFRIGPLAMLMYLLMQNYWAVTMFPGVFHVQSVWWGGIPLLLGAMHAAYWELNMQKSFVTHMYTTTAVALEQTRCDT